MRRPRFIAEQARNARGPLGRLIASIMVRETRVENERAIAALEVSDGDHVLDIGCGPGRSLSELAIRTPRGRVVGADPSELMVEIATRRNRPAVKASRVEVVIAGAEALPFPDSTFDKALSVHVLYFWSDLSASFKEIARVLKPGGRLALLFRSVQHQAAVKAFPADVYRFRDMAEVRKALLAEGFEISDEDSAESSAETENAAHRPHLLLATRIAR
jgi:ubiquinone/menaquinone biosynthesis C-methylase UbiE